MLISQSNSGILKAPVSSESVENSLKNDRKTRLEEKEELSNNNLLLISAVRLKYSTEDAEKLCDHQYVKVKPNRASPKLENHLHLNFPTKLQTNVNSGDTKCVSDFPKQDKNNECMANTGLQTLFGSGKGPPIPEDIPSGVLETSTHTDLTNSSKTFSLSIKETLNEIKGSLGLVLRAKNKGLIKANKSNNHRSNSLTDSVLYRKNESHLQKSEISCCKTGKVSGKNELNFSDSNKSNAFIKENIPECSKSSSDSKTAIDSHHELTNEDSGLETKASFHLDQNDVKDLDLACGFQEEERISTVTSPLSLDDSSIQGREVLASNGDEETESEEGVKLWLDETSSDTNEFGKQDSLDHSVNDYSVPSTSKDPIFPTKEIKTEMSPHEDFNNDAPPPLIPLVEPCILDAPVSPEMPVLTPVLDTREISNRESFSELQDKVKKELFPLEEENTDALPLPDTPLVQQSCRYPKVPQVLLEPLSVQLLEKHRSYVSLSSSTDVCCDSKTSFGPLFHKTKITVEKNCHPSKDNQRQTRLRGSRQHKTQNKKILKEKERKDLPQNGVLTRKKFRELSLKSATENNRTKYLETAVQNEKNADVDMIVIDGIEFFSFETEEALKEYTRQDLNKKSALSVNDDSDSSWPKDLAEIDAKDLTCERPIIPTKTNDITKIKGWRNKVFASETTPVNPSPIYGTKKINWAKRIQLRRQLARVDRKKTDLLTLMKRRRLRIRTRRFNKKVRSRIKKSFAKLVKSINEKPKVNNSNYKSTTETEVTYEDSKIKETARTVEADLEVGKNRKDKAVEENQKDTTLYDSPDKNIDKEFVSDSSDVPKYRFINEKREIQIKTSMNDLASSNPKPIPNFVKAFKTKYGWFQKIGNALIPVGEVSDDIPMYVPALSKSISRPSSLELVTLKSEDAEFAASALCFPEDQNKKNDSGVQLTNISYEMAQMAVTAVINYPVPNSKWEKKSRKRPVKIKEEPPFENEVKNSYKTPSSSPSLDKQLCNNVKVEPDLTENASKCGKSFCSFGCVCDSLKTRRRGRRHCGKVDCMFSCICNQSASDIQTKSKSETVEAKSIIMTDEGPIKRRRATRLPARLLDSAFIWTKGKELLIDPDLDVSYKNKRVRLENKHLKSKSSESPVSDKSRSILNKRHVSTRQSQQETVRLKASKMKFQNEKCKTPKVPPLKITNLLAKSGFPASVQEWTVVSNSTGTIRENDCNSQSPVKDLSPKSVRSEKQSPINPKQTGLLNLGKYSDTKQSSAQLFNDKQDKIKIIGNSFKFNNEPLITTEKDNLTIFRKTPDLDKQHKTESCVVEHTTGYLVPKNLIKNSSLKSILSSPESIPVRVLKSQFTSHKSHNEFGSPIIGIYSIRGVSSHAFIGPIPYKIVAKSNLQTLDGHRLLKKPTEILSSYPFKHQSPSNFENRTTSLSFHCTAQTATEKLATDSDSKVNWKQYCSGGGGDDDDIILCLDNMIKKIENEMKSFCNKSEQLTNSSEGGFTQVFIQGNKILQKMPNGNVTEFSASKRKQIDSITTKPSEYPVKKASLDASICKPLSVVLTKCDPDKTVILSKDFSRTNKSPIDNSKTKEKNSPRLLSAEVAPLAWNKNHEPSVPKNKKERLRRHEIFQCFVRLCAVLDPTAVSSWKKNYEKIPSKVIILKKAKQCIRDLELYSCNIRKFKKALIKRRNSLFSHYSQLLKVLPTDVRNKTVLKLTNSLKQCCAVRKNRSQTQTTWEPDMCKSRVPSTRETIEVSSDDDDDDDIDDDDDDDEEPSTLESDGNSSGGHLSNAQDTANVNYTEMETWQSDENEVGSPTTCVVAVPSRRASELVSSDKPVEMNCEPYNLISETIENPSSKVVIVNDTAQRMYKSRLKMFSPVNSQLAKRLHHSNMTPTINGLHYLKNMSYTETTQNSLVTPYTVYSSEGHLVCNEADESQIVNTYEGKKVHQHLQEMISPDNSEVYFENSEQLYINSYSSNSETAESGNIDLLSNAIPPEDISEGPNVIIVGKPQMIPTPTMDSNAQDDLIISDPSYIVANYNDLGALTALQTKTVESSVPNMEISSKMTSDINSYGGSVAEYVVMEGSVIQNTNVMPVDVFPVEPRFGKETLETSKSKEVISEHFEDIVLPNDDSVSDEIPIELPKIIACSSITEAEFLAEEC